MSAETDVLEVFSDYVWPWCYFIAGRIDKLETHFADLKIRWVAFPLHPETPAQGRSLQELFAGRPVNIEEMLAQLKAVARAEGLPFGRRTMTYNSRSAQELGKWAEAQGSGHAFHWAVFKAYFADGKNLARMEALMEIAAAVGLDQDQARAVIEERSYQKAVDRDWKYARDLNIRAVPTLHMAGRTLVGAKPYSAMEQFVVDSRAGRPSFT